MAKKNILFDFDGVIIDSLPVRAKAFRDLASEFGEKAQDDFEVFHYKNGGMSRFLKIEHLYKNIINHTLTEKVKQEKANQFSAYVKKELKRKEYLIKAVLVEIERLFEKQYPMHIVSASENKELNYICSFHNIDQYFISISGTPPLEKSEILKNLLKEYKLKSSQTIYIGDSINDFSACQKVSIPFFGINNLELKNIKNSIYLENIKDLYEYL